MYTGSKMFCNLQTNQTVLNSKKIVLNSNKIVLNSDKIVLNLFSKLQGARTLVLR